jgi:hypothetical protein
MDENSGRSAYVIAYLLMNFIGLLTGLFFGWLFWG